MKLQEFIIGNISSMIGRIDLPFFQAYRHPRIKIFLEYPFN